MVWYREILQLSIASVTYDYLGINQPKIPIVDFVPDKVQHLHDTDESKIMDEKNITLDKVDIEEIRDDDTKHSPANRFSDTELSVNWSDSKSTSSQD